MNKLFPNADAALDGLLRDGLLIASGDVEARQRLLEEFPTAAFATISFAANTWDELHLNGGRLEHFVTPHTLEAATD